MSLLDKKFVIEGKITINVFKRAFKILLNCGVITLLKNRSNKNIHIWKNNVDNNSFAQKFIQDYLK